jgi:outer membrane protein, heavy metal efflux system
MLELLQFFSRKKPIRARFFILVLACCISAGVHAQTTLTAEEAVRLALSRPEVVRIIDAEIGVARSELTAARTWPNPELSMERVSVDRPGNNGDETSFMLSQQFDLSGRRGLQRRAAELGLSAAEMGAVAERQRIRLEVLRRYYAVVAAARRADAYRTWIGELDELARVAARRGEAGDLSGYESRRIQQSGELARSRLEEVETALLAARERLASLIGTDAGNALIDERVDLLPDVSRFNHEVGDGTLVNAELAALDGRRVSTAAAAQAASRPSLPVTLGVGQRRLEGPVGSDDALLVQLSVPLPLFDRNQAARSRAQAESQRAESLYRMTLLDMQSRLKTAQAETARLAAAAQRLRADVVPQARELTGIARNSFAEGELDLVGLLAAFDAEIEAVNQSLDLQHRARTAWIELEQLTQHDPSTTGDMP